MENSTNKTTVSTDATEKTEESKVRKHNVLEIICAISNLIVTVVVALSMLFGTTSLFSKPLNPISVLQLIISTFYIRKGIIYRTVSGTAVAVCYVVLLVIIIKNLVAAIKILRRILKENNAVLKKELIIKLYQNAWSSTSKAFSFVILCYLISGSSVLAGAYCILAAFLIDYVLMYSLTFIWGGGVNLKERECVLRFIFGLLSKAFFIVSVCLMAKYLLSPSILNLFFGVRTVVLSTSSFLGFMKIAVDLLAKNVLGIVLAYLYLSLIDSFYNYVGFDNSSEDKFNSWVLHSAKKFIIVLCVSTAVPFIMLILGTIGVQLSASVFFAWLSALRIQYIPSILLCAICIVLTKYAFKSHKQKAN